MSQPKQPIFSQKFTRLAFLLGVPVFVGFFALVPAHAASAADCSDVFTPLSSYVTNGVNANKSFYVQAMNETGVPWEMLAAIHYRETNFSHSNPSNGQGIFQFVNGDGGPYPPGPVSDANFYTQLKYMANRLQSDYVWRGSVPRERRQLVANEQNMTIVKDTLFSYNGRASAYANQAANYGYNSSTQPYEGSPYVMNRFDCPRARMGIITQDYATGIDSTDTRYGAFTVFARLRGESFWLLQTRAYSWELVSQETYLDSARTKHADTGILGQNQKIYLRIKARNLGSSTWTKGGANPVLLATASPSNRQSAFCDSSWGACHRPAALSESSVAPGGVGTFEFSMTAKQLGDFKEFFNLVAEGKEWFNDFGLHWSVGVKPPTPRWQSTSQTIYADSARTRPVNTGALSPNTTYYASVKARNTGNTTWSNSGANPVRLGTSSPQDRASGFSNNSWLAPNRATTTSEATVAPGDTGTFNFTLTTPSTYGTFKEYFRPLTEGQAWMNDIGFYWPLKVTSPVAQWSVTDQQLYTDSTKATPISTAEVTNTSRFYFVLKARNTGNTTWSNSGANPVRLGTSSPQDRASGFYDSTWPSSNRAATLKEASVPVGGIGTFEFWMQAPVKTNGTAVKEHFRPVVEGQMWMNDVGMHYPFVFKTPHTQWEYKGQSTYSDSNRTASANTNSMIPNTTYYLQLKLRNTSGSTWQRSSFLLGTSSPNDRTSAFRDTSWISTNRPARLKETSVAPGSTGTFDFTVKTPSTATSTKEYFRPVIEGSTWLVDIGLYWDFTIQ